MLPVVAIVGRPNVGKSTLFNRLVGRRAAIVDATPGVTRDRREDEGRLGDLKFRVIDTAGLEDAPASGLEVEMQAQTQRALDDADVALLVVDARVGITPLDEHFAAMVRRSPTPVILVANKCESNASDSGLFDAFRLGLGEPVAISAEHNIGLGLLHDALAEHVFSEQPQPELTDDDGADDPLAPIQLAIVGRPNVGKSTLVNRLLGEQRVITGPEPGVTRDAIAIEWSWQERPIRLIDTAGMRRGARVSEKLERLSVADTKHAIQFAHVVVLVIDATAPIEKQDLSIASEVVEEGRALIIAVNKWDLPEDRAATMKRLTDRLEISLPQVRGLPVVPFSALSGRGVEKLMPAVIGIYEMWNRRVSTAPLNRWLDDMLARHPPPSFQGRAIRLRYITQIKARPPTFALFASRPTQLPESYLRYLANGLRQDFDLDGVPIRVVLRKGKNPYDPGGP